MTIEKFLQHMNQGLPAPEGTQVRDTMSRLSEEARKITMKMNSSYREQEEIRSLFAELIGRAVDETFALFPPFYTDCGKNIHIGKNVFINAGCHFQDQGGIFIDDGSSVGHNVVLATLNHDFHPDNRKSVIPLPIKIGKNVWIGSECHDFARCYHCVTQSCSGAVVSKDVPANVVVGGVPAKVIKSIFESETANT